MTKKATRKHASRAGRPPGVLVQDPSARPTEVSVIAYRKNELTETSWKNEKQVNTLRNEYPVLWVNVSGLKDHEILTNIAKYFGLHPLALEDIANTHQRPKLDEYGQDVLWVARLPRLVKRGPAGSNLPGDVEFLQVAVYLGDGFVLTFSEEPNEVHEIIRDRLRNAGGRIRESEADYLAYAVMDVVVDQYYPVLDALSEEIEAMEEMVVSGPQKSAVKEIYSAKRKLMALRRSIWPLRDVFGRLLTVGGSRFKDETKVYLRDVADHVLWVINMLEFYRELGSGLLEVYLSSNGNRMNEIMKILTMIATVFLPLTFIAGIYGMNFKGDISPYNMPELDWYFGYPLALGLMAAVAVAFTVFFKRKGWLGDRE